MTRRHAPLIVAALMLAPLPSAAQQFTGMQNDPALMQALNEMVYAFGAACQMGDPAGCSNMQFFQNVGGYMMQASADCLSGNPQACNAYAGAYQQLNHDYGMFAQSQYAMNVPQMAPGFTTTHEQRMQAIQDFGAQNTQNWQNNQQMIDDNHNRFMETLRN